MKIVEIESLSNGGHRNQTGIFRTIPKGWAVIPEDMETENFPFGEVEAKSIDGVMTVTKWTAGTPQETEKEPETRRNGNSLAYVIKETDAMLVEHELKLTLIELGVNN